MNPKMQKYLLTVGATAILSPVVFGLAGIAVARVLSWASGFDLGAEVRLVWGAIPAVFLGVITTGVVAATMNDGVTR